MEREFVLYGVQDGIARITVNRPEVINALTPHVYYELDDAFTQAEKDEAVRVIVVSGSGKHFGAGHDMGSPQSKKEAAGRPPRSAMDILTVMQSGQYSLPRDHWRNIPKPTIAMVQGYCIMASWMLACACDLIVASDDAKFQDKATRSWGSASLEYPAMYIELGGRRAKELMWTGEFIDAQEAKSLGIINRVVPRARLEEETMALAKKIAQLDPWGVAGSKMAINQAEDIMGKSAAIRATANWWCMGHYKRSPEVFRSQYSVDWVKNRDSQFEGK